MKSLLSALLFMAGKVAYIKLLFSYNKNVSTVLLIQCSVSTSSCILCMKEAFT